MMETRSTSTLFSVQRRHFAWKLTFVIRARYGIGVTVYCSGCGGVALLRTVLLATLERGHLGVAQLRLFNA